MQLKQHARIQYCDFEIPLIIIIWRLSIEVFLERKSRKLAGLKR